MNLWNGLTLYILLDISLLSGPFSQHRRISWPAIRYISGFAGACVYNIRVYHGFGKRILGRNLGKSQAFIQVQRPVATQLAA
jgi:hypothetical protein